MNNATYREAPASVMQCSAKDAWQALSHNVDALLIDVRTPPEWNFSGLPDLSSLQKKTLTISWKLYPTFEVNKSFIEQLQAQVTDLNTPLYFLCKTGGRSFDAACAALSAGYTHCFNIADGFEGDHNSAHQRGHINGWKAAQLPWEQA